MKVRNYIKDTKQAEKFTCNICLDICTKPVTCTGPCQTLFCLKCISQWRTKNIQCPLRCTNKQMSIKLVADFTLDFCCQFDKQHCEIPIKSIIEFENHYKICNHITEQQRDKLKYRNQFKCEKGHELEFFIGSYQQMCKKICSSCEDEKLCRATCRQCSEFYCVDCRKTPCCKKSCPIGHSFRFISNSSAGYICDNCGGNISLLNCGVYDDSLCNFGICSECFKTIPQQMQYKVKQNKPQFCTNNHPLCYLKQAKITNCDMCKKQVICPKYCSICQFRYCYRCKIPSINTDKKCQKKHVFVKKPNATKVSCQMCFQIANQSIQEDQQCSITLCQNCFNYCVKVNSDKERFIQYVECQNGHLMHYYSGEVYSYYCYYCKGIKPIKLFCNMCKQLNCVKCIPPPVSEMCYLGHNLEKGSKITCLICLQKQLQGLECEKCAYEICQQCHSKMFLPQPESNKEESQNI